MWTRPALLLARKDAIADTIRVIARGILQYTKTMPDVMLIYTTTTTTDTTAQCRIRPCHDPHALRNS